jgi:hypothetical protein
MDSTNQHGHAMSERLLLLELAPSSSNTDSAAILNGGTDDERVWLTCVAGGARIELPVQIPDES